MQYRGSLHSEIVTDVMTIAETLQETPLVFPSPAVARKLLRTLKIDPATCADI